MLDQAKKMVTYLPKTQDIREKMHDTFGAAVADEVSAVADHGGKGKGIANDKGKGKNKGRAQPSTRVGLTVRQKPLDIETWLCQSRNFKGSHFPLAAFTNNKGRRSEERFLARSARGR